MTKSQHALGSGLIISLMVLIFVCVSCEKPGHTSGPPPAFHWTVNNRDGDLSTAHDDQKAVSCWIVGSPHYSWPVAISCIPDKDLVK